MVIQFPIFFGRIEGQVWLEKSYVLKKLLRFVELSNFCYGQLGGSVCEELQLVNSSKPPMVHINMLPMRPFKMILTLALNTAPRPVSLLPI